VGAPKSTGSMGLIVCPLAYNHVDGYQLSPSLLIIIDCIDSAGRSVASPPHKHLRTAVLSLYTTLHYSTLHTVPPARIGINMHLSAAGKMVMFCVQENSLCVALIS
jgi:hypothetical protein